MSVNGDSLIVAPQSIYEYWSVATRPAKQRGLGLAPGDVTTNIGEFAVSFVLAPYPVNLFAEWLSLVTSLAVLGKESHDARLVAFMNLSGIDEILTFNIADFARYKSITAIGPSSVGAGR